MSAPINALLTQLSWEENEVLSCISTAEQKQQSIQHRMHELERALHQSVSSSIIINPELEINRMNFMMQLHQQKDQLHIQLREQQEITIKLQQKMLRIKTELKNVRALFRTSKAAGRTRAKNIRRTGS